MPRLSERQRLLGDLASAHLDLQLTRYQDLLQTAVDLVNLSDDDSDMSDLDSSNSSRNSRSLMSPWIPFYLSYQHLILASWYHSR